MSHIVKTFKTIKNNWKKSVFGIAAITYGSLYAIETYRTNLLMRAYCHEAEKFGDEPLSTAVHPQHIIVILNPVAKRRKAKKLFEKYCEPLLHLAGIATTIIYTEEEAHARSLVEHIDIPADAFLVAGGDGTLMDVVTGFMRKCDRNSSLSRCIPIGILPLGEANKFANSIFATKNEHFEHIHKLINATMAVIKGSTKLVDVVKVESLEKDSGSGIKPIYALSTIEWGAWRDIDARKNKYWYWGNLRSYVTYIFNGYKKKNITWNCNATLKYSDPCPGCSNCYTQSQLNENIERRWWHVFIPRIKSCSKNEPDYSKITNDNCNKFNEIEIAATELSIFTHNIEFSVGNDLPALKLYLGPKYISYIAFVKEGWKRIKGEGTFKQNILEVKDIELLPNIPDNLKDKQHLFSIDNEEFELKPMKIKLIPNAVKIFCQ